MKALLVIDVQNDFMPGGPLAIPHGDTIIAPINTIMKDFNCIIATQDWHPAKHMCFAANHQGYSAFESIECDGDRQTLWPIHCVQGTRGAEFHSALDTNNFSLIIRKGNDYRIDSFSAFFDNQGKNNTGLSGLLRSKHIQEIYFCGLAADICVYHSIVDAHAEGFECFVLESAVKALDPKRYRLQKKELQQIGVHYVRTYDAGHRSVNT